MSAFKLMEHQQHAVDELALRKMLALFFETGTGKTLVGLRALEYWHLNNLRPLIAIVPNSMTGTWIDEAEKFESPLRFTRVIGSRAQRIATIRNTDAWDVLVISYAAVRTLWQEIVALNPQGLLYDEMQNVKSRRTAQAKACRMISAVVKRLQGRILGMTGTPITHSPLDLWSEFDILYPHGKDPREHLLGYGNYYSFENSVAVVSPHPRLGMRVKKFAFPQERIEILRSRVAPYALEKRKDECLDLPPRTFQTVRLDMDEEAAKVYKALRDDMVAYIGGQPSSDAAFLESLNIKPVSKSMNPDAISLDDEDLGEDRRVSVAFATTLMIRLQQIASGFVVKDDGTIYNLPNVKLEYLDEALPQWTSTDGDHKAILFCRFRHDAEVLASLCDDLKIGHVALTGDTSKNASELVKQFQNDPETRVFIGNIQVASVGITLTAADYCCFYNNSFALGDKLQAIDRPYRIGQTRKVTYYDLVCRNTIDETALYNLREKRSLATATIKNLKEALL